ncbi:probable RNA-dependent RNA polymerase 5 isoform X2 [Vicia villosa]|uniref:probable RNA-dependent RNA polymerase 5 isoform X2 n=1 Tax=Vicia villosa TaxID=3911 RepID=UPI00273B9F79|nr:probable RNA-dependent RNA polymerase 5 isoform X2 [Vicia villosa]
MTEQPAVTLPASVEHLVEHIRLQQSPQPTLDPIPKLRLAAIGEQQALDLLNQISTSKIRNINALIMHMLKQHPYSLSLSTPPTPPPSHSPSRPSPSPSTSSSGVLAALGELEFRKSFLLLSYAGSRSIEDFVSAEDVRNLKDLPMKNFENEIWEAVGKKCVDRPSDRQLYNEWDSGRTHMYHCYVAANGSLRFKGPILQHTRTHLQKSLGDDNVLLVKFADPQTAKKSKTSVQEAANHYGKFGKEGIHVGHRLYRFFVFKDGGKEEKKKDSTTSSVKCYFVRTESYCSADERTSYLLSNKTMFESRSLFMHAHMLPSIDKYMARFSLILSKTFKLNIDLATVSVQTIPDVQCRDGNGIPLNHNEKPCILTDGTGFISEDLAVLCPNNVAAGTNLNKTYIKDISNLIELGDTSSKAMRETALSTHQPPLLIQCRLFHMGCAMKGTLLVNKKLPPRTIQVRPSMIKVETDPSLSNTQSLNSVEVVTTSQKPNRAYLSKNLIALLSYGGVPNEFFMDVLKSNLEDFDHIYTNKRAALRASVNYGEMDEYNAAGMILCGIPLDEPFLQHYLTRLVKAEKNKLRGGKLYLEDCFYVMGTVDPTANHCLKENQVCIIHDNGQITGDVLVYRNPGLHFGDIHIMQATHVDGLESYVGHGKYAIFFPCVGPRSVADEIAGGDFDGDMYWVSKNPQLLQYFKKSDPWMESPPCNSVRLSSSVKKPSELLGVELEEELFRLYLETRFQSSTIGIAADSWMALMDRLLILRNDSTKEREQRQVTENILKLIDIYYDALDAPKKGGAKIQVPNDLTAEIYPHYMERTGSFTSTSILGLIFDEVYRWQTTDTSGNEIRKLPCFDVEIPTHCKKKWEALYKEYRKDMSIACSDTSESKTEDADQVNKIYKQKFDDYANIEDRSKNTSDIYNEALALYHVNYDYAIEKNEVSRCGFVWKVAGSVLIRFYAEQQYQKSLMCNPSVLREIFGS